MARRPPRITSTRRQPTTGHAVNWGRTVRGPSWVSGYGAAKPAPAAGVPAAGASAAPAAPQYSVSNLPPDASYDAQLASLQQQRANQLAALTQGRTSGLSDYGFVEGPNGALTFDPNNPFSQAAQLKKTSDTHRRSTAQSLGAGGQLYSGAFQNAQDLVNRNQVQSEDALQKSLLRFLAQNTQGRTQAQTGYETAAAQAYADRVGRFGSNPLYDPASSAPSAAGATGGGPAAPSVAKPKRFARRPLQPSWRR